MTVVCRARSRGKGSYIGSTSGQDGNQPSSSLLFTETHAHSLGAMIQILASLLGPVVGIRIPSVSRTRTVQLEPLAAHMDFMHALLCDLQSRKTFAGRNREKAPESIPMLVYRKKMDPHEDRSGFFAHAHERVRGLHGPLHRRAARREKYSRALCFKRRREKNFPNRLVTLVWPIQLL